MAGVSSPAEEQPAINPPPAAVSPLRGWHRVGIGEWRLLALIVLLFLLRDMPWRLEESGQAEQAFTSLEMVRAGHWWFQHLPGSVRPTTAPPLQGWISGVLYYLSAGDWDLAWRLPSLLAALTLVVLLWHAGEQLWPRWGGTVAAASFALNFLTPRLAMLVRPEMLFSLETTLLGLLIWSRVRTRRPWSFGARWRVFWLLLAALMTAGPIVYAFFLPGMIVHRWISRRPAAQPLADAWGGWWHWALPLLPFLFWLERGAIIMPGFYGEVIGHPAGRLMSSADPSQQSQPIYFYALQLLVLWAPWSLLFLAVRLWAYRVWWRLCTTPGGLWLVCWAGGGLICLSLFPTKPLDRIFPVVPPLCLILTALLAAARTRPVEPTTGSPPPVEEAHWPRTWSRWALWLACAMTVVATVAQVSLVYRRHANVSADFGAQVRSATEPARCELVLTTAQPTAQDAAMLVYLRRLSYLSPAQAIQLQSTGELDRIVLDRQSPRGARALLNWFDPARPLLVSGDGGQFALLANAVPAPPGPGAKH